MTVVTQFIAAIGPVLLAIMGLIVSLWPPRKGSKGSRVWAAAFIVIGVPTALSIFTELRGTDVTLETILEKVSGISTGPRLEFAGIKTEDSEGHAKLTLQFSNTRDIDAVAYYLVGTILVTKDDNIDIEMAFSEMKKNMLEHLPRTKGVPISRGMGVGLAVLTISSDQLLSVRDGTQRAYAMALAAYSAENTPTNRIWVTEICAKITKPFTDFQACESHNAYVYTDNNLTNVR
jgi:hypothetical protein